jgi:hypothetical protein
MVMLALLWPSWRDVSFIQERYGGISIDFAELPRHYGLANHTRGQMLIHRKDVETLAHYWKE